MHTERSNFEIERVSPFAKKQDSAIPPDDHGILPDRGWGPTGSGLTAGAPFSGLYDGPVAQREASGTGVQAPLAPEQLIPSGGRPMEPTVQRKMESALGGDLSGVRIHTDDGRAKAMNAEAYTVGSDVVFKSGNYNPDSPDGQRRLAHELTHVMQQKAGAVAGEDLGNGTAVSDPSDAFERQAEDNADRMMGGGSPTPSFAAGGSTAGASVQRVVQREESEGGGGDALKDGAKKFLKKYLGKAAGPVVDGATGLYNILSKPSGSVDRSMAAEENIRGIPLVGDKAADYLRKKAPFQGEVDASGADMTGDVTGGNPSSGTVPDAEGNLDNGDGTYTTTNGDIVDRKTGKSKNAGDNELTDERKKELDAASDAGREAQ